MSDERLDSPLPYTGFEFWEAYADLCWHSSSVKGLEDAARIIAKQGRFSQNPKEPLNVLVLGIGEGILDLPLLAALERVTGHPLRLVGLDKYSQPLQVTAVCLERGLQNLPKPTAADRRVAQTDSGKLPREFSVGHGSSASPHLLCRMDLDYLDPTSLPGNPGLFSCFPSEWANELCSAGRVPAKGFDIVVAAFVLLHLRWWKRTLLQSLMLLRKGGLLLHPTLGGDELIFEGRFPRDAGVRNRTQLACFVFDEFYKNSTVRQFARLRKSGLSATNPTELRHFLSLYERSLSKDSFSLIENVASYSFENKIGAKTYISMLQSRGYSYLRSIEKRMPRRKDYDALVANIKDKVFNRYGEQERDVLRFELNWDAYRVNDPDPRPSSFLYRQFGINVPTTMQKDRTKQSFEAIESSNNHCEVVTSESLDHDIAGNRLRESVVGAPLSHEPIDSSERKANVLVRVLVSRGILFRSCCAGDIATLDTSGETPFFHPFLNPLWPSYGRSRIDLAAGISTYLFLLQHVRPELCGGEKILSNTRALLQNFMSTVGRPCVFSYRRSAESKAQHSHATYTENYDFAEVSFNLANRFNIVEVAPTIRRIYDSFHNHYSRKIACDAEDPLFIFSRCKEEAEKSITFGSLTRDEVKVILEQMECIASQLKESIRTGGTWRYQVKETLNAIHEILEIRTVFFNMLALSVVPYWQTWLIVPALYTRAGDGRPEAKECFLPGYDKDLDPSEVDFVYRTCNAVFEHFGMRRSQNEAKQLGRASAADISAHELRHIGLGLSEGWWCALQGEDLKQIQNALAQYTWSTHNLAVTPLPELFTEAGRALRLWSLGDNPVDFFGKNADDIRTLDILIGDAWKYAKSSLSTRACATLKIEANYIDMFSVLKECDGLWKGEGEFCVDVEGSLKDLLFPRYNGKLKCYIPGAQKNWMRLLRFLSAAFANVLLHADTRKSVLVHVKRNGAFINLTIQSESSDKSDREGLSTFLIDARERMGYAPLPGSVHSSAVMEEMANALRGSFTPFKKESSLVELSFPVKALQEDFSDEIG